MIRKVSDYKYVIERSSGMLVEGLIFADDAMMKSIQEDNAHSQVANVATLRGIYGYSMAMPDIHYGYGFPIGGVAAFDVEEGIISPGGIGYDINCGVRLLRTDVKYGDIDKNDIERLNEELYRNVPSGVGSTGRIRINEREVERVMEKGAGWAVQKGMGEEEDLEFSEESGCMEGALPECVSGRAKERGREQIGTLGAGNHFLEIQKVDTVFDKTAAEKYGIEEGQVTVMIHTGSRGLGYQVCDDYLKVMNRASEKYGILLADRQLACAPFGSDEGRRYFSAMKCAANYAWANRQCIMHWVRKSIRDVLGKEVKVGLVYDVSHNVGKVEDHEGRKLIVHRKGATRAFGPGRGGIPDEYGDTGQPVIVPGTMGTFSYVMKGTEKAMSESFGSTCHGAGRVWSRSRALRSLRGSDVVDRLRMSGISVKAKSLKTVAEEAPDAYKDVSKVVDICHGAGLSEKVARLVPLGVVKG
ncbi:MAG: RtcB family protein [Elusimicrobia bacterium]|nr:RtcB family protein [Elusimicrobiota bacterium]